MTKYRRARRSRSMSKRRFKRSRKTTAQRYFTNKMTTIDPVMLGGSNQTARVYSLQQVSDVNSAHPLVLGFDSSPRWDLTHRNYEAYAVKGLALKWIPGNFKGGQSQNVSSDPIGGIISSTIHTNNVSPMFVYFDVDSYDTHSYTPEQVVALDKNWVKDATRPWRKYFSAKALSKAQNKPWQDTATYAQYSPNTLTNASVGMRCEGAGFATNTVIGYMKCTWYVTFKGQAYNQ